MPYIDIVSKSCVFCYSLKLFLLMLINLILLRWLRSLLEHHAGYLTSCPDLSSTLTPVLALMSARTAIFPKMSQLKGRLHLMLGELEHRNQKQDSANAAELPATALLVYREGNIHFILDSTEIFYLLSSTSCRIIGRG